MAPMTSTCIEGKRLTVEALRAAEDLYRLLNMQLTNVVRGESHTFLELRIQRATRKLHTAKSALNAHLRDHGELSCPALLGNQQALDSLIPTGYPVVDADEQPVEEPTEKRSPRLEKPRRRSRTDDFED